MTDHRQNCSRTTASISGWLRRLTRWLATSASVCHLSELSASWPRDSSCCRITNRSLRRSSYSTDRRFRSDWHSSFSGSSSSPVWAAGSRLSISRLVLRKCTKGYRMAVVFFGWKYLEQNLCRMVKYIFFIVFCIKLRIQKMNRYRFNTRASWTRKPSWRCQTRAT